MESNFFSTFVNRLFHDRRFIFLCGALLVALLLVHAWFSKFDRDEIEHLHAAWLVSAGQIPFVDFLEQHNPVLWYVLAPLLRFMNNELSVIFVVRALQLTLLTCTLVVFYRTARMFFSRTSARWSAVLLLLTFTFTRNMMEVRPDPWMVFFLLSSLACWVRATQLNKRWYFLFSGLLFGIASILLQKALVVGLLFFFLGAQRWALLRQKCLADAGAFLSGFCFPVLAFVAALHFAGIFTDYYFWNFTFNRFFYLEMQLPQHFSWSVTIAKSFSHNPVLWLLAGFACITYRKLPDFLRAVALFALCYLAAFTQNRFPLAQYLLPLLPCLAWLAAYSLEVLRVHHVPRAGLQMGTTFVGIGFALGLLLYDSNAAQKQVMQNFLDWTDSSETVFAQPSYHPIFRKDASYFWYNNGIITQTALVFEQKTGQKITPLVHEFERWEAAPPRFVHDITESQRPITAELASRLQRDYVPIGNGMFALRSK